MKAHTRIHNDILSRRLEGKRFYFDEALRKFLTRFLGIKKILCVHRQDSFFNKIFV